MNSPNYPPDFEEFWKVCCRKEGKMGALRAWKKLKPDKEFQAKLVIAMTEHSIRWRKNKTERTFIPLPETWLNKGRYDDIFEQTRKKDSAICCVCGQQTTLSVSGDPFCNADCRKKKLGW